MAPAQVFVVLVTQLQPGRPVQACWVGWPLHGWTVPVQLVVFHVHPYWFEHVADVVSEAQGVSVPTQPPVDQVQPMLPQVVEFAIELQAVVAVPLQVDEAAVQTQPLLVHSVA